MNDNTLVALLSLLGTLVGSGGGVLIANKLINYRLEQLETKFDKFTDSQTSINDNLKERVIKVEQSAKSAHKRLDGLVGQLQITEKWRENE